MVAESPVEMVTSLELELELLLSVADGPAKCMRKVSGLRPWAPHMTSTKSATSTLGLAGSCSCLDDLMLLVDLPMRSIRVKDRVS